MSLHTGDLRPGPLPSVSPKPEQPHEGMTISAFCYREILYLLSTGHSPSDLVETL